MEVDEDNESEYHQNESGQDGDIEEQEEECRVGQMVYLFI